VQSEICHPDRVGIRVAECDPKRAAAFYGVAFFSGELLSITVYDASIHKNRNLREYQTNLDASKIIKGETFHFAHHHEIA
jgi:hypothetical protein